MIPSILRAALDPDRLHVYIFCAIDISLQAVADHHRVFRGDAPLRECDLKCARVRLAIKTRGGCQHKIKVGTNPKTFDEFLHILVIACV